MWKLKQLLKRSLNLWRDARAKYVAKKTVYKWSVFSKSLSDYTNGKTMLHIGCGDINVEGFINIDARPQPHVHIVTRNLFRLAMIPDNVADLIYMSHVLEHVSHREINTTLQELRRILKEGGVLRISVPDFDKIIDIYQASGRDVSAIQQPLMGGQDYAFNYHYAVFNDAHLRTAMLRSGFKETRAWDPKNCDNHNFEDWASRNIFWGKSEFAISLNIEAIK